MFEMGRVMNFLVEPGELHAMIGVSGLLVIDTRGRMEYEQSHIPGAVNCDLFTYQWADSSAKGLRNFLNHMTKVFSKVGVSSRTRVIFYENESGSRAARGIWLMHTLGHDAASLLNGGLKAWVSSGYELESTPAKYRPTKFRSKPRFHLLASTDFILKSLKRKKIKIIDSRCADEYDGRLIRAARGGHIPTAINLDWEKNLNEDGKFIATERLRGIYDSAGLNKNDEIVTYCQNGYRAAHTYLALRSIGFNKVKVYPGSWFEWGNDLKLPVETP